MNLSQSSSDPHNTISARWQWRARTCSPTISLISYYWGISHKRQEVLVTQDAWLPRALKGEGMPLWDRHKNRLPSEFKGLKLVQGREEWKKGEHHHADDLIHRAFHGLRISRLLKKQTNITLLKRGVITSSPLKMNSLIWNPEKGFGCLHLSAPLFPNAATLTIHLAQCLNFSLVLVFP